jgi:hypothetical protein
MKDNFDEVARREPHDTWWYVVMPCECDEPQKYTRPSGLVICKECGGRIEPPQERKIRP